MKKIVLLLMVSALALSGCYNYRMIDFTVISSKNVQIEEERRGEERVEGRSEIIVLFFGALPLGQPDLKDAVDRAIEQSGSDYDALLDGVVREQQTWYLLFRKRGYIVEGTPIKTKSVNQQVIEGSK